MAEPVVIAEGLERWLERLEIEQGRVLPERPAHVEELFVTEDAAADHRGGQKIAKRMVLRAADEGVF